jgi:hypothetical protein
VHFRGALLGCAILEVFYAWFALCEAGSICVGEADIPVGAGMLALIQRLSFCWLCRTRFGTYRVAFSLAGIELATRRRTRPAIPSNPDPISMSEAGSGVGDEGVAPAKPVNPVWLFRT